MVWYVGCAVGLYVINVNVWYVGMCDVCWYVVCRGAGVSGMWYGVCMCVVCRGAGVSGMWYGVCMGVVCMWCVGVQVCLVCGMVFVCVWCVHRRMRRGGGQGGRCPPQKNSGKQWVKFGQSKKKKSARESYKLTPLEC